MTSLPKNEGLNATVESSTHKEGVHSSTTVTHEEHIRVERGGSYVSEDQIWIVVRENHFPDQNKLSFSVCDLLSVTGNIIDDAANNSIVDNILQDKASDMKIYDADDTFISPLCLLKSISCQMSSCKDGEQVSLPSRTEAIFKKLKTFSWEAKAVLTLAAFALEYGEFWHLAQHYGQCDKLTKSVAILKRVPILIKHESETLMKRKAAVAELNNLIMETYHVIGYIVKLQDLLKHNNLNDVPTLTTAKEKIPTAVYRTIFTIVACTDEINRITSDKDELDNLTKLYVEKINELVKELKEQYDKCMKEKAEAAKYLWICKELVICDNITKFISTLILYKDTVNQQPVISCDSDNTKIDGDTFINDVKGKYVLFYLSSLENILKEELLKLTNQYTKIKEEYKCKIVWISIEADWTTAEAEKRELQFMEWRKMMPWYAVQYFPSASYMYLKKEWKVRGNSTAVLINPQGKVENTNALTLIKEFGINFFSFLDIKVHEMLKPVVDHIKDTKLQQWMENQGYTFFIGGKTEKTTDDLVSKITKTKHPIEEELKIQIGLASVSKESETAKTFWFGMENLVFSLAHSIKEYEYKHVTKEVHKLLSHKDNTWIMLTKGWTVVTCGLDNTIYETLEKFSEWKQHKIDFVKEWEHAFTKYHDNLITGGNGLPCTTFQIARNAPMHLDCPVCEDPIETKLVTYNCCHPRLQNAAN